MITIICGTHREGSNSERVSNFYSELLKEKGQDSQVLLMKNLPSDFLFADTFTDGSEDFNAVVNQYIANVERFVFVIPEYNGGFPGVLKAFIDAVTPKLFEGKKACLVGVSTGRAGALRPLDHFTHVLHHLKVEVLSEKPKLSSIHMHIEGDTIVDEQLIERLNHQIGKFLKY